jgi:LysM repeat protein
MMVRRSLLTPASVHRRSSWVASALAFFALGAAVTDASAQKFPNYPITEQQRSTAQQVAAAGVPLSELAPDAPDSYTVKRGDTLWAISTVFLRTPWRWAELWGMNLEQIRNPHLIYPGQVLYLEKVGGRARLRVGEAVGGGPVLGPDGTNKLSPRARTEGLGLGPIAAIPMHLIQPFLNEAVIFNTNELDQAPRIVASQEGRVMLGRGDTAYVRGELADQRDWRMFRTAKALYDPSTFELLGYEAPYVGTLEYTRPAVSDGLEPVPATFVVTSVRMEAGVGDRLAPVPPRDFSNYVPHAPSQPISGQIAALYGDAMTAGQNQIVVLNKGTADGVERGHVLALLRDGRRVVDPTDGLRTRIKLPNERHGTLFVFRVFDRMSYALVMTVEHPVEVGDRFTQP